MEGQEVARGSGILLAVSSLPSEYGIGTLGDAAFHFVDLLVDLKQKYWQVLPVGPTSFGDSPYQSLSAFAGNPYLIDLDQLAREKLLTPEEIRNYYWGTQKSAIDYAALFENRTLVLQKAFGRFDEHEPEFQQFVEENRDWVEDYGLYMALKVSNGNQNWQSWPENIQKKQPVALAKCRKEMYNNIMFWVFCQYKFFQQWGKLREYANSKGIQLIGDVPFYVGKDSVDTWMHPEQFLLDENGEAAYVAAAIPDKFSETGQVWGNPLYNWPLMQEDGFSWWKRRMQISTKLFDVIRMDHFIGFVKNYMVPKDATDASGGRWMKGPADMDAGIESPFPAEDEQEKDKDSILSYYKNALRLRNQNPEIARGTIEKVESLCKDSQAAITKTYQDSTIGIVYNLGEGNGTVDLKGTTLENMNLEGSLTLKEETVQLKDGKLEMPACSIAVLK